MYNLFQHVTMNTREPNREVLMLGHQRADKLHALDLPQILLLWSQHRQCNHLDTIQVFLNIVAWPTVLIRFGKQVVKFRLSPTLQVRTSNHKLINEAPLSGLPKCCDKWNFDLAFDSHTKSHSRFIFKRSIDIYFLV